MISPSVSLVALECGQASFTIPQYLTAGRWNYSVSPSPSGNAVTMRSLSPSAARALEHMRRCEVGFNRSAAIPNFNDPK